ncbi:MAG TPA: PH domain-containing protein [Candidatus Limnocylindria bacterium]|nr:PH domain-containing protein [Candidatus Limnocylindria bacterium]
MAKQDELPVRSDAVLFWTGLHAVSIGGALGLAAFIGFVGLLIIRHNDLPLATDVRIALGCLALGALTLAGPLWRLRRSVVAVTPGHLELRLGAWRPRTVTIPVRDIRSVEVRSGPLGRRLDFGTLQVIAADDAYVVVHHVRAPQALRAALRAAGGRR